MLHNFEVFDICGAVRDTSHSESSDSTWVSLAIEVPELRAEGQEEEDD
jgi:hypothetical protein